MLEPAVSETSSQAPVAVAPGSQLPAVLKPGTRLPTELELSEAYRGIAEHDPRRD